MSQVRYHSPSDWRRTINKISSWWGHDTVKTQRPSHKSCSLLQITGVWGSQFTGTPSSSYRWVSPPTIKLLITALWDHDLWLLGHSPTLSIIKSEWGLSEGYIEERSVDIISLSNHNDGFIWLKISVVTWEKMVMKYHWFQCRILI